MDNDNKKLNELFDRMSPDDIDLMLQNFGRFIKEKINYHHSQRFIKQYTYSIQKPLDSDKQACELLKNINIVIESYNNQEQKNKARKITYSEFYKKLLTHIPEGIILKESEQSSKVRKKKPTLTQTQKNKDVNDKHFQKNGRVHLNNFPLPTNPNPTSNKNVTLEGQQKILGDINQMLKTPFDEKNFNPEKFIAALNSRKGNDNSGNTSSTTSIASVTPPSGAPSFMADSSSSLSRRNSFSSPSAPGN